MVKTMNVSFRPVGNVILVELVTESALGKIVLPDGSEVARDAAKVRVVAVGQGRLLTTGAYAPIPCEVGDRVCLVQGYNFRKLELDGREYLAVDADSILGVYGRYAE